MDTVARYGLVLTILLGLVAALLFVTTPLTLTGQAMAAATTLVLLFAVTRTRNRAAKFVLAGLAIVTSSRYMYWRLTSTMDFDTTVEAALGLGMFAAECFIWFILLSNFVQNLWPAGRKVAPLPEDTSSWPTVDVFITTYNEPLDVVRPTILAARAIDYPRDKLNVYVLDDGRREEFRDYASAAGVGYITRDENRFAKAGNLNNALQQTDGELVAVFDCDHVPTRAFLQKTVGWFLEDPRMAVVQTPHHFYNKDPVERNLPAGGDIPNEGLLFYGLTQDGNDFWNAAYFCGSCAVLRREALEDVGGFAVETVTEDAHTSLRLHRRRWNSAYVKLPLAAGLATESVPDHVGQRMRWARGMIQILRLENPLFGRGLTLPQRLCYLNSMLHFLFPLPRIVLLTAPLAYLLFGQHIINAAAWELLAYAGPHLVVALVASVVVMDRYRYVLWAEIYETLLSFHLALPALATMLSPFKGRFNVTNKGIARRGEHYQWRVLRTLLIVAGLLLTGIGIGVFELIRGDLELDDIGTAAINIAWAAISLVFIGVALAVGREAAEYRSSPRIDTSLPAVVQTASGHSYPATTLNISTGGAALRVEEPVPAGSAADDGGHGPLVVELPCGSRFAALEADVLHWQDGVLRIRWAGQDVRQAGDLVRATLGRDGAWAAWGGLHQPSFLGSIKAIFKSIWWFVGYLGRSIVPRKSTVS